MTDPEVLARHLDEVRILDLFAGPGGLDVAAHFLGLKSLGIEWDGNACETRYAAGLPTIHADVRVMREDRFDQIPKSVDILAGGPPCQSFSVAGTGAGRRALETVKRFIHRLVDEDENEAEIDEDLRALDDPRTALVLEPLRWLLKAIDTDDRNPYEVIVLEQVPAVMPLWEVYAQILRGGEGRLGGVKYEAECWQLKTEEYGVPQTRTRAVLIARRPGRGAVEAIPTTHRPFDVHRGKRVVAQTDSLLAETSVLGRKQSWVSMADSLRAASQLSGSCDRVSRFKSQQSSDSESEPQLDFFVVSNYGSGGDPKNRGRRQASEPAFTVTGKVSRNKIYKSESDLAAGRYDRFTIAESGVLQTFPHNFPWSGQDQAQQVGNAVPPRLGMHVLSAAVLGAPPSEEALAAARSWPNVPATTSDELRALGCGDQSQCPAGSHRSIAIRQNPAAP
ncbi:DNA cytosine methyltransferase [Nocardia sp. XZ_19_385]|uniref:DNA cytosine methyltransferase n=1 Tax=Nocardia sp. XZ_19_385 TaxID=2769488 RepID=UPI00188E3C7A|nr:DNA cytosine methyltransferase [Nocardia sp. XZ_19_385]